MNIAFFSHFFSCVCGVVPANGEPTTQNSVVTSRGAGTSVANIGCGWSLVFFVLFFFVWVIVENVLMV